jgi:hypothetical protein
MKTRVIIFLAITAVITLSFTFITVKSQKASSSVQIQSAKSQTSPVGGFAMEDAL